MVYNDSILKVASLTFPLGCGRSLVVFHYRTLPFLGRDGDGCGCLVVKRHSRPAAAALALKRLFHMLKREMSVYF